MVMGNRHPRSYHRHLNLSTIDKIAIDTTRSGD
jgi:hypothetical protein